MILNKIIEHKKNEVSSKKSKTSIETLKQSRFFRNNTISLKKSLNLKDVGFICEFKRKSPSKGFFHQNIKVEDVVLGYEKAGASAVSILTDTEFFAGSIKDILSIRNTLNLPILRKDFIIDSYQIFESKSIGADIILLICECLTKDEIKEFTDIAHDINLEVLLELHSTNELDKIYEKIDFVGINNRDLKTFKTSIQNSIDLYSLLPKDMIKISESGLSSVENVKSLQKVGYKGFLIGENFMKEEQPAKKCKEFIEEFNSNF